MLGNAPGLCSLARTPPSQLLRGFIVGAAGTCGYGLFLIVYLESPDVSFCKLCLQGTSVF